MRCFLGLIRFIGVVFFLHANHSLAASKISNEGKEINCLVSTSYPPLSAIENSGSNSSGFNYNYSTHLQKRFGIYFIAGNSFSLRSAKIPQNNIYNFSVKSTSLFLLNKFSQPLLKVFKC